MRSTNAHLHQPYIYVIINKELGMSAGKVASQAAQGAAATIANHYPEDIALWAGAFNKGIIVLEARNEAHLRNIKDYLRQRDINSEFVIDEGVNEVPAHSITALSTQMMTADVARVALRGLRTYRPVSPEEEAAEALIRFLTRG